MIDKIYNSMPLYNSMPQDWLVYGTTDHNTAVEAVEDVMWIYTDGAGIDDVFYVWVLRDDVGGGFYNEWMEWEINSLGYDGDYVQIDCTPSGEWIYVGSPGLNGMLYTNYAFSNEGYKTNSDNFEMYFRLRSALGGGKIDFFSVAVPSIMTSVGKSQYFTDFYRAVLEIPV